MVDNQEKITLTAELQALRAQLLTADQIAQIAANTEAEYAGLKKDIETQYAAALKTAEANRDAAIAAAHSAYEAKVLELDSNKELLEQQSKNYYDELVARDNAQVQAQVALGAEINAKAARLQEILDEEERLKAEEEARIRAEAAAKAKATVVNRPKIHF